MARVLLVVTGVVAAVVGAVLLVTGGLFAASFGPDSSVTSQGTVVQGEGVALLLETVTVEPVDLPLPETIGTLTLEVTSDSGAPIFVGVAMPDDLDAYLVGAPYDVVVDALPANGVAETRPVPGTQQPAPPATQQFWLRQDTGAAPRIPARLPAGAALLIMNEDASPGVAAVLQATLEVKDGWTAAVVAAGAGAILLLLALFLIRAGVRRRPRPGAHSAPGIAAVGAGAATDVVPGAPLPDADGGLPAVDPAPDPDDAADDLASPGTGGG